uniref:SFRICE_027621 n=1 Tax=Spodoptera frugiperda TaxID=7108 RepID=A0A2H1WL36_SPOFR
MSATDGFLTAVTLFSISRNRYRVSQLSYYIFVLGHYKRVKSFLSDLSLSHTYATCASSSSTERRPLLNKGLPLSPPRRMTTRHLHPLAPRDFDDVVGPPSGRFT